MKRGYFDRSYFENLGLCLFKWRLLFSNQIFQHLIRCMFWLTQKHKLYYYIGLIFKKSLQLLFKMFHTVKYIFFYQHIQLLRKYCVYHWAEEWVGKKKYSTLDYINSIRFLKRHHGLDPVKFSVVFWWMYSFFLVWKAPPHDNSRRQIKNPYCSIMWHRVWGLLLSNIKPLWDLSVKKSVSSLCF